MSDYVFFQTDTGFRSLQHVPFALEDDLQQLLNASPELISVERGPDKAANRLLLVRHEAPVADRITSQARWSLDHLFIDEDCVPTLVESKRARNPEVRREVVGQLLEYAAQAWTSWTTDEIVGWIQETHAGQSIPDLLTRLLNEPSDLRSVAEAVAANLRAGRMRLIFVADGVPDELQAIVEFLNAKTAPDLEVLAVELRVYGDKDVIVPRVIGEAATVKAVKRRSRTVVYEEQLRDASTLTRSLDVRLREAWRETGRETTTKDASLRLLSHTPRSVAYFYADGQGLWVNGNASHPVDLVDQFRHEFEPFTGPNRNQMLAIPEGTLARSFEQVMPVLLRYTEAFEDRPTN